MGLTIRLFGEFEALRDGILVPKEAWGREKTKAVLKILVSQRGKVFKQDELIEKLWPEMDPQRAASNLRGRIAELRHALEPSLKTGAQSQYILTRYEGYGFSAQADCWLDTEEFVRLYEQGSRLEKPGQWEEALQSYEQAAQLYRGDFLEEDRYEDWAIPLREKWQEKYLDLLSSLAECHARLGQYRRALARCHQALRIEAYRESFYRQLMLYYYLAGDQREALQAYEQCRKTLQEELGAKPAAETQRLYEQIQNREIPGIDQKYQPIKVVERHPIPYSLGRIPFVGREADYALLISSLKEAKRGKGRLILIGGEAGVGKTRLVQEALAYVRKRSQACLLQGRCQEMTSSLAFQPLIAALREPLALLKPQDLKPIPPLWLAEVANLMPELRGLLPDLPVNPALPSEQARNRQFEGLTQFLLGLIPARELLVLFLDDLHWSDPSTVGFLSYLLPSLERHKLLVLGTYRSEEVAEKRLLLELSLEAARRNLLQEISLDRLSREAVDHLLGQTAPGLGQIEAFQKRLYQETEGNPFFLVAVLQALLEAGAIRITEKGRWETEIDQITVNYRELMIPKQVRDVIQRRVERLNEPERRLLGLASVIGHAFEYEVLHKAWEEDEECLDLLEHLSRVQLLVERAKGPRPQYEFSHDKIREVVYEELSGSRRQQLHARVTKSLEEFYAAHLEEQAALLAHHYAQAGIWDKALDFTLRALRKSTQKYQWEEGLTLAKRALELLNQVPLAQAKRFEKRFEVLQSCVEIHGLLGRREEQGKCIQGLFELAHQLADATKLFEAYRQRSGLYQVLGRYAEAKEDAQRALEMARAGRDKEGEASALNTLGSVHRNLGEYPEALKYYQKAYELYQELGHTGKAALALNNLGAIYGDLGRYETALEHFKQALRLFEEVNDRMWQGLVLVNIGDIYSKLGDYERALHHIRQGQYILQQIGVPIQAAYALHCIGSVYRGLGKLHEALMHHKQTSQIWKKAGNRLLEAYALHHIALVHSELREHEEAKHYFEEAQKIIEEIQVKDLAIENLSHLGTALLGLGKSAEALAHSQRAIGLLESSGGCELPQAMYFNHFQVLWANKQIQKANTYLRKAHEKVMRQAEHIKDKALRKSFLENVRVNQEILAEYGNPKRNPHSGPPLP